MANQLKEPVMFAGAPLTASILTKCLPSIAEALNEKGQLVPQSIFRSMLQQELNSAQTATEKEFAELVATHSSTDTDEQAQPMSGSKGRGSEGLTPTAALYRTLQQAQTEGLSRFDANQRLLGQPDNMVENAHAELAKKLGALLMDALDQNERSVQVVPLMLVAFTCLFAHTCLLSCSCAPSGLVERPNTA
jgi:hypothetical protein